MYLLDTNVYIRFLNDSSSPVIERFRAELPESLYISSISKAELLYGAHAGARLTANLRRLEELFATVQSLPFDDSCADHYAQLRAYLRRAGRPIGPNDMFIAAIALANNLTLVTANVREFGQVPELRFENWEV